MAGWIGLALSAAAMVLLYSVDSSVLAPVLPQAYTHIAYAALLLCIAATASLLGLLSPGWSASRQAAVWGSMAVAAAIFATNLGSLSHTIAGDQRQALNSENVREFGTTTPAAEPSPRIAARPPRDEPPLRFKDRFNDGPDDGLPPGVTARRLTALRLVELAAGAGGHFFTTATVDNTDIQVLIDTGASAVALSYDDADRAGLKPWALDYQVPVATANGVIKAARVTLRRVEIGPILVRDVDGLVMPEGVMQGTLLGMSFLSRLRGFRLEGGRLVLED